MLRDTDTFVKEVESCFYLGNLSINKYHVAPTYRGIYILYKLSYSMYGFLSIHTFSKIGQHYLLFLLNFHIFIFYVI